MAHIPFAVPVDLQESSIKSSQDVLTLFAQKILSGEGNILRHLKFLGFQVVYRQSALEEFDFKTRDLSQDLRDGLRLCRLIEKLKGDGTSLCKVCFALRSILPLCKPTMWLGLVGLILMFLCM